MNAPCAAVIVSEVLTIQHMAHEFMARKLSSSSLCPLQMRSNNTLVAMADAVWFGTVAPAPSAGLFKLVDMLRDSGSKAWS